MAVLMHWNFVDTGGGSEELIFDRLEITKPANMTDYYMNSTFNIDGLEVTAVYIGNETEYRRVVTNECTYNPTVGTVLSSTGNQTVTISYSDLDASKTTSYTIYIKSELDYYAAAPDLPAQYVNSNETYAGVMAATNNHVLIKAIDGLGPYGFYKGCAYDTSLVAHDFNISTYYGGGASVGTTNRYALFGAGKDMESSSTSYTNIVEIYNDSLTKVNTSRLPNNVVSIGAGSSDSVAVFAGGSISGSEFVKTVTAFNQNLTKTTLQTMYEGISDVGVGISDTIIVAASGQKYQKGQPNNWGYSQYGCVYRVDNLTCINAYARTTYPKKSTGGVSAGNYVLLIGGIDSADVCDFYADCWNSEGTKLTDISLIASMRWMSTGTSKNNDYALALENQTAIVFSKELVQFPVTGRSVSQEAVTATVGDYTFAGCGYGLPNIDVYKYTPAS